MHLTKITESDAQITVFASSIGLQTVILAFSSVIFAKEMPERLLTFALANPKNTCL